MGRYAIEPARPSDDGALKQLAADNPMHGRFRVSLRREPSFFYAVEIQGPFSQVGVARDLDSGRAVGCATRAVRTAYLNGEPAELGYLGGLRLDPRFRGGTLLARAYRTLRRWHEDGRTRLYVTTVIEDNHAVRQLLSSRRAGLPVYHDWGRYHTLAIGPACKRRPPSGDFRVERGDPSRVAEIVECLRRNGRRRQFFPRYTAEEFLGPGQPLRDFRIGDFHLAMKGDRVAGVAATWDQTAFKQTVLAGYGGIVKTVRPLYNLVARWRGLPRLPLPGSELRHCFVSFLAIDGDDLNVFRALLGSIRSHVAARGYDYFLVGLHERDPLLPAAREYPHRDYVSRLYVVYWEDGADACRSLDGRVPYLELAVL